MKALSTCTAHYKKRVQYLLMGCIIFLVAYRMLFGFGSGSSFKMDATDHYCTPFGLLRLRHFVWSHQASINNSVGSVASRTLLDRGINNFLISVSLSPSAGIVGAEQFLVAPSSIAPLYQPVAKQLTPDAATNGTTMKMMDVLPDAKIETLQEFVSKVVKYIPKDSSTSTTFQYKEDLPIITVKPAFDANSEELLVALLEQLYADASAEETIRSRIAVLCHSKKMVEIVNRYSPKYVAFTFDGPHTDLYALAMSAEKPDAVHINTPSLSELKAMSKKLQKVLSYSASSVYSSSSTEDFPGEASKRFKISASASARSAAAAHRNHPNWLREVFPNGKVVVSFVDTPEQLLWAMEQGVDGVVSNHAIKIQKYLFDWYTDNCSLQNVVLKKLLGISSS